MTAFFALLAALLHRDAPIEHRYALVNGPDYVLVSREDFAAQSADGGCLRLATRAYPDQHLIVHLCDV